MERPALATALAAALCDAATTAVALVGAGGFGKTRLATMVGHDPAIAEAFPGGRLWASLRQETIGAELTGVICALSSTLDPSLPLLPEPLAAGVQLGKAFAASRTLLIVDNVWSRGQVEPFRQGGDQVVRLFTTRRRDVLPSGTRIIDVPPMTDSESGALLTRGLSLSSAVVDRGRAACGSWPLLLSLVHDRVSSDVAEGRLSADEWMGRVLDGLQEVGITALNVNDADERDRAVARTIDLSLAGLTEDERDRFLELAVFAVGVRVPFAVVARFWARTGEWQEFRSDTFCLNLFRRSLLVDHHRSGGLLLHETTATYIRQMTAGQQQG